MKLAADANVLLSALIGGQAVRVFRHAAIEEILTTEATLAEVQEYAPRLAQKKRLPVDVVLLAAATLPVVTIPRSVYVSSLNEARRRIGRRDPDDVEILALALHFHVRFGRTTMISKIPGSFGIPRRPYWPSWTRRDTDLL